MPIDAALFEVFSQYPGTDLDIEARVVQQVLLISQDPQGPQRRNMAVIDLHQPKVAAGDPPFFIAILTDSVRVKAAFDDGHGTQ